MALPHETRPASPQTAELVRGAHDAQRIFEIWSQQRVDTAVTAAGWAIIETGRNGELGELAVADTGVGNVADNQRKNNRKAIGLLRDDAAARSRHIQQHPLAQGSEAVGATPTAFVRSSRAK